MSTHPTFLQMTTLFGQRPLSSPQTRKLKDSLLSERTFSLSRVSLQLGHKIIWINRSLLDQHLKDLGNLDLNVSVKRCKDIIVNSHIFFSFCFQPHFHYCNVLWGNCNKGLYEKLQRLQNGAARTSCL